MVNLVIYTILMISITLIDKGNCNKTGEMVLIAFPNSINFTFERTEITDDMINDVMAAVIGLHIDKPRHWYGLEIKNPFSLPEAIVQVYIYGIKEITQNIDWDYRSTIDIHESKHGIETFVDLSDRIKRDRNESFIVYLDFTNKTKVKSRVFGNLEYKEIEGVSVLRKSSDLDGQFLKDLGMLAMAADHMDMDHSKRDGIPDLYFFHLTSLKPLVDKYGEDSPNVLEAKQLIKQTMGTVDLAFRNTYQHNVMFSLVANTKNRRFNTTRAAEDGEDSVELTTTPKLPDQDSDVAAMRNIIFWYCVIMFYSLVAICHVFVHMELERDSTYYILASYKKKKH